MLSRTELVGWFIAFVGIIVMGSLVAHGRFGHFNPVAAAGGQTANANANLPQIRVSIQTDAKAIGRYVPETVTVHTGQSISFSNQSNAPHTVTDRQNRFNIANIATSETAVLSVPKPGVYHYFCLYHPLMHGTLIVKA